MSRDDNSKNKKKSRDDSRFLGTNSKNEKICRDDNSKIRKCAGKKMCRDDNSKNDVMRRDDNLLEK
jgi:hypothetical protein